MSGKDKIVREWKGCDMCKKDTSTHGFDRLVDNLRIYLCRKCLEKLMKEVKVFSK